MKMKRTALFFASTAILFSSPSAMADQAPLNRPFISSNSNMPLMLAQAEEAAPQADPEAEVLKKKAGQQAEEAQQRAAEEADAAAKAQQQAEKQAKQQADQAAKAAEAEAAQKADEAQRAAQAEADKAAEQQKAVEEEVKRKAAAEAKAAKAAEKEAAQEAEKAKRATEAESNKAAEQQKAVEEEARKKAASGAEAAKAAEQETAKEAEKAKKAAEQEAAKAAEAQKATEEEARKKADGAQKAADKQTEKAAEDAKKAADKAAPKAPAQAATPETPATAEKPAGEQPATTPDQTTGEKPAVPVDEAKPAKPADPATGQPVPEGNATAPATAPADATQPAQQEASPLPENAAPVLDSDKPAAVREGKDRGKGKGDKGLATEAPAAAKPVAQEPATPPTTDAEVQQQLTPVKIEPVLTEKGTRTRDRRPDERPADVQVIKQFDNRTIVEVNNNVFVESSDRPRMSRNAQEVYYEDLPRRRTRETIVRDNGVQIITIRNRYGDVIQRSRVTPDGREVLLTYTPDYDREDRLEWRDPGDDLPPLRLTIPVRDYIMDAEEAPEEDVYEFFAQPPVERVERIYSVDEVKRSARIRDKVRRVDLDTITFQFGSAEIGEDQIVRIESVAKAMAQILKKNPAETFLIEGHTDAVGSDQANLVLSDKRAESVAQALTNVFDIPPENMATQGYGERYLKIKADGPEQQNRRVAIRRITPLVAPMASNN
ncbi:OmpA family protein [Phyllobacterium zundukense]|uniref:OmpA-like domain-containing protein n=1 Tax=Phyllobacterium zundukense TaxID=1867719 RepID=A0A2N9VZ68_9HYPH|nr:OmpA family protein [Phyllobacterium zundukense]PIO44786.1 hypothetical protein B5P45_10445 [Phyllobacterium zundukense]